MTFRPFLSAIVLVGLTGSAIAQTSTTSPAEIVKPSDAKPADSSTGTSTGIRDGIEMKKDGGVPAGTPLGPPGSGVALPPGGTTNGITTPNGSTTVSPSSGKATP